VKSSPRWSTVTFVPLVLALFITTGAPAQQTGAVSGTVTEAGTQQPVADAQVFIQGTDIGTLTDGQGQYTIRGVPAGPQTVVVQHIGHARATRQVEVETGQAATADFQLATDAVQMEQLVVTGAGVTQQKKQLGQTVATVNTEDLADVPKTDVQGLLQGRVAGLSLTGQAGEAGSSGQIRLRGTVSLSQRQSPLLYVDGVRVHNKQDRFQSVVSSTINDINPENIKRIEVLKGAAAATLYGTEASAGVIQIYTKRGANTDPRWSLKTTQQLYQMPGEGQLIPDRIPDNVVYNSETGQLESIEPEEAFLRNGHRQEYHLSVRGGSNDAQYFGSVWYNDEKSALPVNANRNSGARLGLDFQNLLGGGLGIQSSVEYIDNKLQVPSPPWGLLGEATLASPLAVSEDRPYGGLFHSVPGALATENTQERDRLLTSVQLTQQWTPNLTSRATVGYNSSLQTEIRFAEKGRTLNWPTGLREVGQENGRLITLDVSTAWEARFSESLSSSFTVGAQSFWENTREDVSGVQDFPAPGLKTLRGASSVYLVDEFEVETINAGIFGQEQIGLNDRLFLTLGVRLDGSSAFGEAFDVQPYPKAGLSWVVSDEPFWESEVINHLRLRAAYGTSGLQPGAYDALRTWRAISAINNQPALQPQSIGNVDLKPERSVERELGAEIGLLNDRISLDVTYFWQTTEDAILERRLPASQGFIEPQFVNIGELGSKGLESSLTASLVQSPSLDWSVDASFGIKDSEVKELADIAAFRVSNDTRVWNFVKEGYQPGAVIGPVPDPDNPWDLAVPEEEFDALNELSFNTLKNAAGGDSLVFVGNHLPSTTYSLGSSVGLPQANLRFDMMWRAEAGFTMFDETNLIRATIGITPRTARWAQELDNPNTSTERRRQIAEQYAANHPNCHTCWVQDADYLKLQELSMTWSVPNSIVDVIGLEDTRVTFSGNNLLLFTKYGGMADPGTTTGDEAQRLAQNVDYYSAPIPPRVGLTIRTSF